MNICESFCGKVAETSHSEFDFKMQDRVSKVYTRK